MVTALAVCGAIQAMLMVALVINASKVRANHWLAAALLCGLANQWLLYFKEYSPALVLVPHPELTIAMGLLGGALVYAYFRSLTSNGKQLGIPWSYFVPAVMVFSLALLAHYEVRFTGIVVFAGTATSAYFLWKALELMNRYEDLTKDVVSDLRRTKRGWLTLILTICLTLWLFNVVDRIVLPQTNLFAVRTAIWFISLSALAVFALSASPLFRDVSNARIARSAFTPTQLKSQVERLVLLMENDKPYLNQELNLAHLSQLLGLKSYQVTEVIKVGLNSKFYEFVNQYRVREVQRRFRDPQYAHQKILSIALDSGFATKSAFNEAFRKITGQTPVGFRQSLST